MMCLFASLGCWLVLLKYFSALSVKYLRFPRLISLQGYLFVYLGSFATIWASKYVALPALQSISYIFTQRFRSGCIRLDFFSQGKKLQRWR
ncbi:hypothetical protein GGR51DRAFT_299360 [Nemania sp. FL0031]|nr:hypothetical protein GGR51DRAFT_299360 [Nemania sp. FL0031]